MFGDSRYTFSLPNCHQGQRQRLDTYRRNVAELASGFAAGFDSFHWTYNAACLHGFGKADDRFQVYPLREKGLDDFGCDDSGGIHVNHSNAGAALAQVPRFSRKIQAYHLAGASIPRQVPPVLWNLNTSIHCMRLSEDDPELDEVK